MGKSSGGIRGNGKNRNIDLLSSSDYTVLRDEWLIDVSNFESKLYAEKRIDVSKFPITEKNYHIATIGDFNQIDDNEYNAINAKEYTSNYNSKYKIKNGILYRKANHWGSFATVKWNLIGKQGNLFFPNYTTSGKINLKKLKRAKGMAYLFSNKDLQEIQKLVKENKSK